MGTVIGIATVVNVLNKTVALHRYVSTQGDQYIRLTVQVQFKTIKAIFNLLESLRNGNSNRKGAEPRLAGFMDMGRSTFPLPDPGADKSGAL